MKPRLGLALAIVILSLALASCVTPAKVAGLPLSFPLCHQGFVSGHEVLAVLRLSRAEHNREFLIALRTDPSGVYLAVLTPHGLPVYSVHCGDTGPEVSLQANSGVAIAPLELLTYLELIYAGPVTLSSYVRPGWSLQEWAGERLLWQSAKEKGISIQYEGTSPWFSYIKLEDRFSDIEIVLNILETSLVLPE